MAADDAAELLSALRPKEGVLAVLGNHDTGSSHPDRRVDEASVRRLVGALAAAGLDVLENEERTLVRGKGRLRVAGFGDLWSDRPTRRDGT
jgi:predicted MPP superfamily phosphohydrolase